METYSRRENVKFVRLPEELANARIHRLGKPKSGSSRPIIVRFLRYGDKQLAMDQARKHLKDTDLHVYDDIPKVLYDSRKGQLIKFHQSREKGFTAYFSKVPPDKLFVNQKIYCPW